MDLGDLTLFKMAMTQMDWVAQRQQVLSQNIANADTLGYQARDVKEPDFKSVLMRDTASVKVAAAGTKAQATRLRVIAENIANADSTSGFASGDPYLRKVVTFRNALARELEADMVKVKRIYSDRGELDSKYDPTHPAADENGYVLQPDVNPLIEMMETRAAQRSYEANMNVINTSRHMMAKTLELLK